MPDVVVLHVQFACISKHAACISRTRLLRSFGFLARQVTPSSCTNAEMKGFAKTLLCTREVSKHVAGDRKHHRLGENA